jgi:hypothetical protein
MGSPQVRRHDAEPPSPGLASPAVGRRPSWDPAPQAVPQAGAEAQSPSVRRGSNAAPLQQSAGPPPVFQPASPGQQQQWAIQPKDLEFGKELGHGEFGVVSKVGECWRTP